MGVEFREWSAATLMASSTMLANFSAPKRLALGLLPLLVAAVVLVAVIQTTGAEQPGPSVMPENPRQPSCYDGSTPTPVPKRYVGPSSHYQGMTPDEITEHHNQARQAFWQTFEQWIADFNASGIDIRTLSEEREALIDFVSGWPDLATAVQEADVIVVGETVEIRWRPNMALLTVDVDVLIKGAKYAGDKKIEVVMSGGPFPGPDYCFKNAKLMSHYAMPLLLPGDRAVLFLTNSTLGLGVYPWTGEYLIKGGRIRALEGNDFKDDVEGLPVGWFLKLIQSHLDP
jgi:hypothetical protein